MEHMLKDRFIISAYEIGFLFLDHHRNQVTFYFLMNEAKKQ